MSTTPDEPVPPTLEERVAQLEQDVSTLHANLDAALTANAVLQERYGTLTGQNAALSARIEAMGAPEATP